MNIGVYVMETMQDNESSHLEHLTGIIDDKLYEEWIQFLYTIWQRIEYL
jgi:hypothetical protein